MENLQAGIDAQKTSISEMMVEMKRAGEDRELANKVFQQTVSDQQATRELLTKALDVLKGFYDNKPASLLESASHKQPAGAPPPSGFKSYSNNKQSGGVMGLLSQIIEDAKAMEADALKAELEAQTGYESFIKETNAAIGAAQTEIMNQSDAKAKA